MSIVIDESNPCAAAATLRGVYRNIIAGAVAQSVSFKTGGEGGTERSTSFNKPDAEALLRQIRQFEAACAASKGQKPRRFAARAGGRR